MHSLLATKCFLGWRLIDGMCFTTNGPSLEDVSGSEIGSSEETPAFLRHRYSQDIGKLSRCG